MFHISRRPCLSVLVLLSLLAACGARPTEVTLSLSESQLDWVGQKIFQNECAAKEVCLVHWNEGEAFPSLGIGHFIWYPAGVEGRFVESFPSLITFMRNRSVTPPQWLGTLEALDAPWPDRQAFLAQQDSERVRQLRTFLAQSKGAQAAFMFARAQASLSRVVAAAPEGQRHALKQHLAALSNTPGGTYALIDYVNFKGEGLAAGESYAGQGWGLLQVLQQMPEGNADTALSRFREAAAVMLTQRAENAPKPIEKQQWLRGWLSRLETYQEPPAAPG